ncbi:MAG: 2-oxoacid:acceptor oxidoreductase family protein, partial [Acidobacteriota bacterium]|nr:2-oxoacid:acceptor oxidoreductase family protein [Acidobacteriota bacterium]
IQDGFLTTHTLETVRLPELELMRELIAPAAEKIRKLFDPESPLLSGPVQNQDSYMKGKIAQRVFYDRVTPALESAMEKFTRLTGRPYSLLRAYRMEDAEFALVGMGSMMETAEATVDYLRGRGMRIGVVHITSFRPFPSRQLAQLLAKCRKVAVIERCDVPLAQSNPLTVEVKAALADAQAGAFGEPCEFVPQVYSGVAGLGGRDVRPGHFVAAAENMARLRAKPFFVLGVRHGDALPLGLDPDVRPANSFALRGHSIGGFGSVTTNKVMAAVSAELFGMHVQAFPKYGSEKKGLPTNYYLTLATEHIRLHAELKDVDFVAIQDANAFLTGDPLAGLREGGVIYMQSSLEPAALWAALPSAAQAAIRKRDLQLYLLDAQGIARDCSSRVDLQIRMQGIGLLGAFLRLTPFRERAGLSAEQLFEKLEQTLHKYFGKRGARVVADNLAAARRGYEEVLRVVPPEKDATLPLLPQQRPASACAADGALLPGDFCDRIVGSYLRGQEDELEADEAVARSLMPPESARHRSLRNLAPDIPEFLAAACVGCMECVNQCPDTAILAKVAEATVLSDMLAKVADPEAREAMRQHFCQTSKYYELPQKRGETGGMFGIFVDPDKCKGCGECVVACGKHEALKMAPKNGNLRDHDLALDLYRHLPETPARFLNEKALGDMMLAERSLLYTGGAGSCMGCGEATAIRMMLAATSFVYGKDQIGVVAATGCNSVYGSTYPYNPYAVPWTNSLFENAPADAMGIRLRWDQEGHSRRRLWVIGGDGAMYDIGFQSLSRMMMSGMDIKVLVLDTQVYSNTGGQSSTATFTGQDAKMAAFGKSQSGKIERRKDLGQIMMMHPGVFVAQTTA